MKSKFSDVRLVLLDFDGVITDNYVYVSENGTEVVKCNRSDGIGISRIKKIGIQCCVISSEKNSVVEIRCKKLNIPFKQNVKNKELAVLEFCNEYKVDIKNTLFLGNDINDIPAFKIVGFPVAVSDAYPEVKKYVSYETDAKGGQGAVREVCDLIFNSNK